jgi:antitoxin VapB
MSEEEIAGLLFSTMQARSVKPTVLLVAADDRLTKYRHPIPTPAKVKNAVMFVVCARRWGLVCSATRIVGFGKPSPELRRKHEACVYVDATFIASSKPGTPLVEVFEKARTAYAERGFPNEWCHHHQGGPTGYVEREFTVNPETPKEQKVEVNMGLAWNPSIAGTKSEDTILVTAKGPEILTATPGWPMIKVPAAGRTVLRPDWLVKA